MSIRSRSASWLISFPAACLGLAVPAWAADVQIQLGAYDGEGQPYSVRYYVLPSLLLNEMQKQQGTIEGQAGVIDEQRAAIVALVERVERLESRYAIESVSSHR